MSWVVTATVASSLMSSQQAARQQEAQKQQNLAEAEKTKFSWATGGPQGDVKAYMGPSAFEGAVSGGIKGAAVGQQLSQGFEKADTSIKPTNNGGQNYLNANIGQFQMSPELQGMEQKLAMQPKRSIWEPPQQQQQGQMLGFNKSF